jgi:hypothetical protein
VTAVVILLAIASAVLVVEFSLTAVAGMFQLRSGMERFVQLTGITPQPQAYRVLGVLALAAVIGIVAGIRWPGAALAGATYCALLAIFTLLRQVTRGQRGSALYPYSLYLVCALIVIVVRAAEIASTS